MTTTDISWKFLLTIINIILFLNAAECARILGIFPMPGVSHYILDSKLMKGLAEAGHDVTMISPYKMKDPPKNGKYKDVVLDEFVERFQKMLATNDMFQPRAADPITMLTKLTNMLLEYWNDTFYHPKVKKVIQSGQKFDAVIMEQFNNDALKVFSHIFDCPLIMLSTIGPNSWVNPLVGNPNPISYNGHFMLGDFSNDITFIKRAKNLLFHVIFFLIHHLYAVPKHEQIMHQAFPKSPDFDDIYTNVSLVLLNSHPSLYPPLPLVPNMVEIGGYFIDPPKKLPEDLQKFFDDAPHGAIYFSMGSNLKSKDMPSERKKMILRVLGKLKQKVLWKFEEDLPDKPGNVLIRKWCPQQDILAHPNVKLFITHGGLLSTTETVYHGVPILAIPVFGDQSANADRAVSGGYGLKLAYHDPEFTEERFTKLIKELLSNPQYRENIQRRSKIYHDRPVSPMQNAVYWVEYVIRHKGAPHLRVAGVRLPWYQYYMVDVFASLILAILLMIGCVKFVIRKLCCSEYKADISEEKKIN